MTRHALVDESFDKSVLFVGEEGLVVNFVCMTLIAHMHVQSIILHIIITHVLLFEVHHSLFVDIHVRCMFNFI